MKLSQNRISGLSRQMAETIIQRNAVLAKAGKADLASFIREVIDRDQDREAAIEEEARKFLTTMKHLPPPGTGEYQATFIKAKEMIAKKRGFKL